MTKRPHPKESAIERAAHAATRGVGSPASIVLHSLFFVGIFALELVGFAFDQVLLILTTAVSLEAIYLAIFIQMSVNRQAETLAEVSEDVEDISEDVEEISKDIDEIQEDVEDISEDIDEIQEDVEDLEEEDAADLVRIEKIEAALAELLAEVRTLKERK
jgi:uncharacterized membrane protein